MSKKILAVAAMLFMSFAFIACGGDDPVSDGGTGAGAGTGDGSGNGAGGSDDINTPSGVVAPNDEKAYIDAVGKEFVSLFNASDYQDVTNVAKEISNIEGEGMFEDFIKKTQTGTYEWTQLLALSNVKGAFSAKYGQKKWQQDSKTGNLTMTYTDKNGTKWVLSVQHNGSWGVVNVTKDDDWVYDGYPTYTGHYETTTYQLDVPKSIQVTLTKGNETVADVKLNITDINIKNNEPSINAKAAYNLTAKVKDFDITNNVAYTPNGAASVVAEVKKGNKTLVTVNITGNTNISNNEITDGNVSSLNVCVLNKLNVKGDIKNIKALSEAIEKAQDNDENESAFDRWVTNANSYINLGLYNNNPTKQASIVLGKDSDRKYYYGSGYTTYFRMVPMVAFSDGTKYSLEEYFDDDLFENLMNQVENVIKDFERLVD